MLVKDSIVYSLASGSAALSSSAGSTIFLQNSAFYSPAGGAERLILGGSHGYDDIIFNRLNSTFGTSLAARAHFQHVQADVFSGSFSGSIVGSVTIAETASFANSGFTINSSSLFSLARPSSTIGANSFTLATGSTRGSVLNYTVNNTSNARTGQVMTSWVGSNIVFNETHTPDIGSTSGVSFTSSLSGANVVYNFGTTTAGWDIEFIVTHI
jgi:hypothetical protein